MTTNISGVLLAAGASTRFGSNKLLETVADDTAMAVVCAQKLISIVPNCIAVVAQQDEISEQLQQLGFSICLNPQANRGMASSLACGIDASTDATGWIIALADMPLVRPQTIAAVANALAHGAALAAPVYQGQRGHPAGFSSQFRSRLLQLQGDKGAREILRSNSGQLQYIDVDDPGVIVDIDLPRDLNNLRNNIV